MSSNTAAILGGGIGGIVAANELRRRLPESHRVMLIERAAEHVFPPSFLWLMTGSRRASQLRRPLRSMLRAGVEHVHAEARAIDTTAGRVHTTVGDVSYDHLIVALGAELSWDSIPGLSDTMHTFFTFEGTVRLASALREFSGGEDCRRGVGLAV